MTRYAVNMDRKYAVDMFLRGSSGIFLTFRKGLPLQSNSFGIRKAAFRHVILMLDKENDNNSKGEKLSVQHDFYNMELKPSESQKKLDEGHSLVAWSSAPSQQILEESMTKDDTAEDAISEQLTDSNEHGTIRGAISLIIGTSIGSGILALPARTAPAGFIPSAVSMVACWGVLVLEALLLAEVNVALIRQHETSHAKKGNLEVISLRTMAEQTLGKWGENFATISYIFLTYTLMVVYIAKSGDLLSFIVHIPASISGPLFICIFSILVLFGGTKLTDEVNQLLTTSLIGFFLLIVVTMPLLGHWMGLNQMNWDMVPQTIPVILFSLVYHDLIPVLCAYLGGDISRIRISIILGSMVPLVSFIIWDAVALGLAPISGGEDPLDFLMRLGGTGVFLTIHVFSLLAITTALIGTLLGLSTFFMEQLRKFSKIMVKATLDMEIISLFFIPIPYKEFIMALSPLKKMMSSHAYQAPSKGIFPSILVGACRIVNSFEEWWIVNGLRFASFVLVIIPPLLVSTTVTEAFFTATDIAGAYGMTTLYGLLPPAMAWALSEPDNKKLPSAASTHLVIPGGRLTLAGIGICACGVIVNQMLLDSAEMSLGNITDITFVKDITNAFSTLH